MARRTGSHSVPTGRRVDPVRSHLSGEAPVDELRSRIGRLEALQRAATLVTSSLDTHEICRRLVESARGLLRVDAARLWVADEDGEHLRLVAFAQDISGGETRLPVAGSLLGQLFRKGEVLRTEDVSRHPRLKNVQFFRQHELRGCLGIPLPLRGQPYGTLSLLTRDRRAFSDEDVELLQSLGHHAVIALEHARLFEEAGQARALQEAQRMKGEFLSVISHELAGPLTAISGYAHVLREMAPDESTVKNIGRVMAENSQALARMIEDLVELSSIESGRFSLRIESVDLAALARAVAESFVVQSDEHRLVVVAAPDLPPIAADPDRVRQILGNLLSNAVRYSPDGGEVRVRLWRAKDSVNVEVADEGLGIAPENLARVFEPFYREPSCRSFRRRGAGLGLAIVQQLVDAHGGAIQARSEPGRGSRFTFTLPIELPL